VIQPYWYSYENVALKNQIYLKIWNLKNNFFEVLIYPPFHFFVCLLLQRPVVEQLTHEPGVRTPLVAQAEQSKKKFVLFTFNFRLLEALLNACGKRLILFRQI
jgi:hypothetical protein